MTYEELITDPRLTDAQRQQIELHMAMYGNAYVEWVGDNAVIHDPAYAVLHRGDVIRIQDAMKSNNP